jgi:hypothetical protein
VSYDAGVLQTLREYRARRLPNETGGVLLGIVDMSRRSIHVAHAMPQPEDSRGSLTGNAASSAWQVPWQILRKSRYTNFVMSANGTRIRPDRR